MSRQEIRSTSNFISLKEAARYLDVSYLFMLQRIGKPEGPPAQKIGARWKLPKEEFIKWASQPIIK